MVGYFFQLVFTSICVELELKHVLVIIHVVNSYTFEVLYLSVTNIEARLFTFEQVLQRVSFDWISFKQTFSSATFKSNFYPDVCYYHAGTDSTSLFTQLR